MIRFEHLSKTNSLRKDINLRFNVNVKKIELDGEARKVYLTDGSTLTADLVLYATGRHPNTAGLGLDRAGVALGAREGSID